jgi:hypothetical protein
MSHLDGSPIRTGWTPQFQYIAQVRCKSRMVRPRSIAARKQIGSDLRVLCIAIQRIEGCWRKLRSGYLRLDREQLLSR